MPKYRQLNTLQLWFRDGPDQEGAQQCLADPQPSVGRLNADAQASTMPDAHALAGTRS